jgi:hypothetical protein
MYFNNIKTNIKETVKGFINGGFFKKSAGIDGVLVTVGLCIIALLLCVVMKDRLALFIETIVASLTDKAAGILSGT